MSRMAKTTIFAALVTSFVASGCRPNKGTASPEDYFPLIQVSLQGGEVAAMIGHNEAVKAKNFGGCVASSVLGAAFDSAGAALNGKLSGDVVIPGFDLDLSECLALREAPGDENASFASPVVIATMAAGYSSAPEEAATETTEEKPAEEAVATEEKPAEEAPVEEASTEEEAEATPTVEEVAAGNAQVAALVEGIAGIAIIGATSYANKLKATNCTKGTAALAAIGYVSGMVKPIADEIADPDGKVSVPAMPVDLSACVEG